MMIIRSEIPFDHEVVTALKEYCYKFKIHRNREGLIIMTASYEFDAAIHVGRILEKISAYQTIY